MAWRVLNVAQPSKLSLKDGQLFYQPSNKDEEILMFSLEDIAVLILEHHGIIITNALLAALAENGITVFSCDSSHIPNGVYMPFFKHSRYSQMAWQQIQISAAFKKRLWQKIVKAKIVNQAEVLRKYNKPEYKILAQMVNKVVSGDTGNIESIAAREYWNVLFIDFNRNKDCIQNAALNYGYAILRGCVARFIVGAGLIPAFGVHHANQLNSYNLADDLIEPFRAFIDYLVLRMDLNKETLVPSDKHYLIGILTHNCSFNKQIITVLNACEFAAMSLAKSIRTKNPEDLLLPSFSD